MNISIENIYYKKDNFQKQKLELTIILNKKTIELLSFVI